MEADMAVSDLWSNAMLKRTQRIKDQTRRDMAAAYGKIIPFH